MARYDIPVPNVTAAAPERLPTNYPILAASGALYYVYIDTDSVVVYIKSTDRGLSWSAPVDVGGAAVLCLATWYDRWSSSSGDVIHIAYTDGSPDDVLYRPLNTATDTLGTETVVFAGASATASQCILSIVKSRGGNLYCAFNLDSGTEEGFYRSTDSGGTWGARSNVGEAALDRFILMPGFAADTQDIICIYWDISNDEISRKNYDDSGDSWATEAEASIATSMVEGSIATDTPQFSAVSDLSNSRILLAAWSARDLANADLRFWTITEAAITESATNVVLNSTDDQGMVAVGLATDTSTVYVFYVGKSDGSETMNTAVNIYYKTSTDVGATWSAETKLNTTVGAACVWHLQCAPRFIGNPVVIRHCSQAGTTTGVMVINTELSVTNASVEFAVGNDKTTGTSLAATTTVSAAAGELIVATLVTDNESATDGATTLHTSVTIGGTGMTKASEFTNSQGSANAGMTTSVWYLLVQSAIIDGVAVAATLNTGKDAKAIELRVFPWPSSYTVEVDGTNTLATDGADPGSLTATGSRDLQHLWWRGIGSEEATGTVGALTPTSGWTATTGTGTTGGAAATNASVRSEWKLATGTGSGASDPTLVSADHASVLVGFAAIPPGGVGSAHVIGG